MIQVSGYCDGCHEEVQRETVGMFTRIGVDNHGYWQEFDFCPSCLHEIYMQDESPMLLDKVLAVVLGNHES